MITDIEQAAEKYADNCSYPQPDEHFKTTYWIQHNIAVDAFKAGAVWQQSQQPKDLQDLQVQVRDHIRNHNLFDWEEALTDNEMIYLENLLLTFNPLCPPGSIGFEEQKKHISNQSQQPKEADGWISVEDRLPEKRKDSVWSTLVLIYGDEEYDTAAYRKDVKCWSEDIIHVTHWQPLPSPPKNKK